jgi:chromosome segregation ATPase
LDKRLERLVAITEYNVQQISGLRSTTETHSDQIVENTRQMSDLRSSAASLLQVSERQQETLSVYRQNFEAVMGRLQQVGYEIRGLQTENRRILDQLINRGEG